MTKIKTDYDDYEVLGYYNLPISDEDFTKRKTQLITSHVSFYNQNGTKILLSIGSEIEQPNNEEIPNSNISERI